VKQFANIVKKKKDLIWNTMSTSMAVRSRRCKWQIWEKDECQGVWWNRDRLQGDIFIN